MSDKAFGKTRGLIVEGPHHGTLTLEGQTCSAFDYSQLLSRSVIYRHDGSETTQDQLEFQIDITSKRTDFPWLDSTTYVLRIRINPVNDPPELTEAKGGHVLKISAKGSIHDEGVFEKGVLRLVARDGDSRSQVDRGLVRFRHTSSHHPKQDMFSFQVFNREAFMLNGTESGTLSRANLFAWTFPKSYPPEKLVYHIEEPPKYGILSRKINGKSRRIGVSTNFTQLDLDNRLISFKLHFMQYSIINDFFLFRVITPAISSESLRFEIIFVPTQTSIQLVNRTVVVQEGDAATITSDSLSLATPDDSFFVFTLALAPIHGALVLKTDSGNRTLLVGMNFTTRDVAEEKLIYFHSGSESRSDRLHLIAESAFRKGRRIPFWMSFSIIPINDNKPRYTVSDGKHTVEGLLRVIASDPFIRLGESLLEYCCLPGDTPNLR
ncbi:unnamed protein product, partial [Strongylus vulgaris]